MQPAGPLQDTQVKDGEGSSMSEGGTEVWRRGGLGDKCNRKRDAQPEAPSVNGHFLATTFPSLNGRNLTEASPASALAEQRPPLFSNPGTTVTPDTHKNTSTS